MGRQATEAPKRALVVEDSPVLRRSLERILEARCAEIRSCGTRREAVALLGGFRPDLVLLDVYLPDGEAHPLVDLCARQEPPAAVVVMTGSQPTEEDRALQERPGLVRVRKPLTARRLDDAIRQALRHRPGASGA